jgi:hypothetical protein
MQHEFNWLLLTVHDGSVEPQLLFMTDEPCLNLSGRVAVRNVRIWSNINPHAIQQVPSHSVKSDVLLSAQQISGPVFFNKL